MNIKVTYTDALFSKFIRARDQVCQFCGVNDGKRLEAAHIFGRGKKSVRYDPENVYAMHGGPNGNTCHRFLDTHTTEKLAWCEKRLGKERFNRLMLRSNTCSKPDLKLIRIWVKHELAKMRMSGASVGRGNNEV